MSLRIDHLCEKTLTLTGTLDGCLPVTGEAQDKVVRIKIAAWIHEVSDDVLTGAEALRYAVIVAINAYRKDILSR